jgi:CheY-like chemotaxis protein
MSTKLPRILLADNDEAFLELLELYLTNLGYEVVTAKNRAEARERLREAGLALALIDYRLERDDDEKDHSGVNVAFENAGPFSPRRIILTVHKDNVDYTINALKPRPNGFAPAQDYVSKHKTFPEIAAIVERAIGRKRVFLSYLRSDQARVSELYEDLQACGLDPWMDLQMPGGYDWARVLEEQIRKCDCFVPCLSTTADNGEGFREQEIRWALEVDAMRMEENYFIPLRLEECERDHRYQHKNFVDLFKPHGLQRLVTAIRGGVTRVAGGAGEA